MKRENSLTSRPSSFRSCSHSQWPAWWNQIACRPGYASTTSSVVRAAGSRSKTAWMSSRIRFITSMARSSYRRREASRFGMGGGVIISQGFTFRRFRARAVALRRRLDPRLHMILVQLVFDRVNQRLPARFDDVARKPDRAPSALAVGRFYQHAHSRFGAGAVVEHTDLVVDQLHRFEVRIVRHQRLPERRVERVDRPIANRSVARARAVGTLEHDHGFAERRLIFVPFVVEHAEADEVEMLAGEPERAEHQELERRVGAVEGVAQRLEPFELVEQRADIFVRGIKLETELLGLVRNICAARQL